MSAGGNTLLFGFHAVMARLKIRPESVEQIFYDENRRDPRLRDALSRAQLAGVLATPSDAASLTQMAQNARHQGIVAAVSPTMTGVTLEDVLSSISSENSSPLFLVLDEVTDPHNLGACLRSADVFGVTAVICPKDRSVGVTATVAKVASGASDTVPVIYVTNLARALTQMQAAGVWCVAADMEGENLFDAELTGAIAWVLGAEGKGIRRLTREKCDRAVSIPMQGQVESLNVSVAAGICLAATRMKQHKANGGRHE